MADDTTKSGGQDRRRINVEQDYEVRSWSDRFGVTAAELKRAVSEVGTWADDVEAFLQKAKKS